MVWGAIAVGLGAGAPQAAMAQSAWQGSISAIGGFAKRHVAAASVEQARSGAVFGATGSVSLARFLLDVRYVEGALNAEGLNDEDLVEGEVFVGVRPVPWLTIKAGSHIRSFVTGDGTERWVLWEARVRLEPVVFDPTIRSFVEVWRTLGSDIDLPSDFDRGWGVDGGLLVRLAPTRLSAMVGYRVDNSRLESGARTETVEQFILGIGVDWY